MCRDTIYRVRKFDSALVSHLRSRYIVTLQKISYICSHFINSCVFRVTSPLLYDVAGLAELAMLAFFNYIKLKWQDNK